MFPYRSLILFRHFFCHILLGLFKFYLYAVVTASPGPPDIQTISSDPKSIEDSIGQTSGTDSGSENSNFRNNWAVIIDTSRYFYNYRHASNSLSFYHTVKRLGIPDDRIILFLAEDFACNPRNVYPGTVYNSRTKQINLYHTDVEVDYRGDEVSPDSIIRLFSGRHHPQTPRNQRLMSDRNSNVLIFATGHSGAQFLKVSDWLELQSQDLADAFHSMYLQGRYSKLFWIADTCQAETLSWDLYSPNIMGMGSSKFKENSYSHHGDPIIGAGMIDRFTQESLQFFERRLKTGEQQKSPTVQEWVNAMSYRSLMSTVTLRTDLLKGGENLLLTDFFASTGEISFFQVEEKRVQKLLKEAQEKDSTKSILTQTVDSESELAVDPWNPRSFLTLRNSMSMTNQDGPDFDPADLYAQNVKEALAMMTRTEKGRKEIGSIAEFRRWIVEIVREVFGGGSESDQTESESGAVSDSKGVKQSQTASWDKDQIRSESTKSINNQEYCPINLHDTEIPLLEAATNLECYDEVFEDETDQNDGFISNDWDSDFGVQAPPPMPKQGEQAEYYEVSKSQAESDPAVVKGKVIVKTSNGNKNDSDSDNVKGSTKYVYLKKGRKKGQRIQKILRHMKNSRRRAGLTGGRNRSADYHAKLAGSDLDHILGKWRAQEALKSLKGGQHKKGSGTSVSNSRWESVLIIVSMLTGFGLVNFGGSLVIDRVAWKLI